MADLIRRNVLGVAREALDTFPVVVIQGARQVGKSTFARMLAEGRPYQQISLDDREIRDAASTDPRAVAELHPQGTVIIDEVQRDLDLMLALKSSIDADRRPGRFILTGSSDLLRLARNPDSLAGRAVTIDLHGLSQGEIAGRREDFATWLRSDPQPQGIRTSWEKTDYIGALTTGGYPEVRVLTGRMRHLWLDSYVDRLLSRDIGDVSRGLSSDRLASVLRLIAANQSGELVQTRLASDLGMAKSSIAAYLAALRTIYLTMDLPPWGANLTSREVSRHKVSVADSALAVRLDRVDAAGLSQLTAGRLLGELLEAFVVGELTKQRGWSDQDFELYHFRDSGGVEVDIVVEFNDGMVVLLEVKASQTYGADQFKGIRALAEKLKDRFLAGIVLGTSTQGYVLGERLYGLPIATLWQHP